MARRPLPRVRWPLPRPDEPWLCGERGAWMLQDGRAEGLTPVQVDVVLDLGDRMWLRLRWARPGPTLGSWLWPRQCHVWLNRRQQPLDWSLLRAHLWPSRRPHWLGAP